ncbi:hypothetical protein DM45_3761 [Burkholderia mallei]|nr:hypothetical protein DM45_3761 [Burkholderia mallei]KOT10646.1 hypothetical protein DM77_3216 [Burkholderia mallei]KOT22131.1 hypothetical protein DM52_2270 [Burkholderia mallei]
MALRRNEAGRRRAIGCAGWNDRNRQPTPRGSSAAWRRVHANGGPVAFVFVESIMAKTVGDDC